MPALVPPLIPHSIGRQQLEEQGIYIFSSFWVASGEWKGVRSSRSQWFGIQKGIAKRANEGEWVVQSTASERMYLVEIMSRKQCCTGVFLLEGSRWDVMVWYYIHLHTFFFRNSHLTFEQCIIGGWFLESHQKYMFFWEVHQPLEKTLGYPAAALKLHYKHPQLISIRTLAGVGKFHSWCFFCDAYLMSLTVVDTHFNGERDDC